MDERKVTSAQAPSGATPHATASGLLAGGEALLEQLRAALAEYRREARAAQNWTWMRRCLVLLIAAGAITLYLGVWGPLLGLRAAPAGKQIGVIHLVGTISDSSLASAARMVPAIEDACADDAVSALVLKISSAGGSPSQAARIARALERCRAEHGKRIVAVIEGVGASAAYLIAVHADEIVADPYAVVGSIGAVISGFDASVALGRLGVNERAYASGELKSMLSLWRADTEAQAALAGALVHQIADEFADTVRRKRAAKLAPSVPDFSSGRVWVAAEAQALGLIDDVAVLEDALAARFPGVTPFHYDTRETLRDKLDLRAVGEGAARALSAEQGWSVR